MVRKKRKYTVKWGKTKRAESSHKTMKAAERKGKQKKKQGKTVLIFYPPGHDKYVKRL